MADIELLIIGLPRRSVHAKAGSRAGVLHHPRPSWRECMRRRVMRGVIGLSFLLGLVVFSPVPAVAQDGGIRGGISVDPDQFYFGGHFETSPLINHLYFRPNL